MNEWLTEAFICHLHLPAAKLTFSAKWIELYPSRREQYMKVNNDKVTVHNSATGIPTIVEIQLYADDTLIYLHCFQRLRHITIWSNDSSLKSNVTKATSSLITLLKYLDFWILDLIIALYLMVQHRVLDVPKKDCFCFEEVLTVNELFLEQHLNNRFYCQFISEKSILTLPPSISWSWYVNIRILSADWPFLLPFVLSCIDFCFGNALTLFGGGAHLGLANIYHV